MAIKDNYAADTVVHIYIRNSNLMLEHALNNGLAVPVSVTQVVDVFNKKPLGVAATKEANNPLDIQEIGQYFSLEQLVKAHDRLAELVSPVTPRSLLFLAEEKSKQSSWSIISPIKFIRQMVLAAMLCLVSFILLGMLEWVNFNSGVEVFEYIGLPLLSNLLFYMSAAGLGASFAALFSSNEFVEAGTFDPKYKSSYWIRFLLGLVSGMLLASLIPLESGKTIEVIGKPTLAMIGGFSASLVYRILNGLVESIEVLFGREPRQVKANKDEAVKAKKELGKLAEKHIRQLSELSLVIHDNEAAPIIKEKIEAILNDALPPHGEQALDPNGALLNFGNEFSEDEEKNRALEYDIDVKATDGAG